MYKGFRRTKYNPKMDERYIVYAFFLLDVVDRPPGHGHKRYRKTTAIGEQNYRIHYCFGHFYRTRSGTPRAQVRRPEPDDLQRSTQFEKY